MGYEVRTFEEEWANYCGKKYCVGVGSGTEALKLTLEACKIMKLCHPGYSVPTTPFTFWATTQAILDAGLFPLYHDVDRLTGNLKDQDFHTSVALPVRMYGRKGNWRGTNLIEDMAHAHGQKPQGLAGCFSFYPTKNLGAIGQAGAVVTDSEALADMIRCLREYGEKERFHYRYHTGNHRMDELQAAILRAKLPYLDQWNQDRKELAMRYIAGLEGMEDLIVVPPFESDHVYHIFAIKVRNGRDDLSAFLSERGIGNAVRYPVCCHQQKANVASYYNQSFPRAEEWAATNLTLPLYPGMPSGYVDMTIEAIDTWYRRKI